MGLGLIFLGLDPSVTESFQYDDAGQLTNVAANLPGSVGDGAYVYLANGNRSFAVVSQTPLPPTYHGIMTQRCQEISNWCSGPAIFNMNIR